MPRVVICDKCENDKACVAVCPAAAFVEKEDHVVINPDMCIDCGACEMACPRGAIVEDDDPEGEKWASVNEEEANS